jgi:hypothetical protein
MDLHILKGLVCQFLNLRILKGLADFAEYFNEYHTIWLSFVKVFFNRRGSLIGGWPPGGRSYGCA